MSRDGKEVLEHHVNTMLALDFDHAAGDYSEELAAIARLDGHNRTLGYDSLLGIMQSADKLMSKLNINMESAVKADYFGNYGNYAVFMTGIKPIAPFASFTYMIEDGKARYVSGYCKSMPMPSMGIKEHSFEEAPETMAVMDEHLQHLADRDVEGMASDYVEDAVILTNLAAEPFVGKDAVRKYCESLVAKADAQIEAAAGADTKRILKNAVQEMAVTAFQHKKNKLHGVLTQRVQNGKIVFESLIFQDAEVIL